MIRKKSQYQYGSRRSRKVSTPHSGNTLLAQVIVPLIIGFIGVFGTIAGVYTTYTLTSQESKKARAIEYEMTIVNQRIEIINQAARIYGKEPGISDLWLIYLQETSDNIANGNIATQHSTELSEKLADYNSEYESVVWMAALYFGPKTREALAELGKETGPWWTKNPDTVDEFMVAMVEEINLGIEFLPDILQPEK